MFLKLARHYRECQYTIQYTYDHTFSNATVFYLALAFISYVVLVWFLNEESILAVCFFIFLFL
jgi:hypothetical protein